MSTLGFSTDTTASFLAPGAPDAPLIVSTPSGLLGSYDPPKRSASGRYRPPQPTVISAPKPVHPAKQAGPAVQRLENMYGEQQPARRRKYTPWSHDKDKDKDKGKANDLPDDDGRRSCIVM